MTHASLCTGIGACELAASWLGWDNAFSCEINPFCQRVLRHYYPKSEHYGNIFDTDFTAWRGKIDVLTAGFPCQPFSFAGQRKGAEDDRYLWPEVLRAISEIRPSWFVGENVAGITSMVLPGDEVEVGSYKDLFDESYQETEMRQQFIIDRICDDLESIGYTVQPIIIPACAVGAPHRRDRIWFIANRTDTRLESMQQWQNGVYEFRLATNPTGTGLQDRIGIEVRANEKETGTGLDKGFKRLSQKWIASNADGERFDNRSNYWEERQIHLNSKRYSTGSKSEWTKWKYGISSACSDVSGCWEKFPTQSPVCGRNDGIPDRLSDITVSAWVTEAIKALGNSMVPQVVLEIFKAIEKLGNIPI